MVDRNIEQVNLVLKCAVFDNNVSSYDNYGALHNSSNEELIETTKAAEYGAITGIAIAVLINVILSLEYHFKSSDPMVKLNLNELFNTKTISRSIILIFLVLVMPLVLIILLSALLYKIGCAVVIKTNDKRFVKFLDSFDVFWSLEDDTSKSIINVLGVIESSSPRDLINNIKSKLEEVISSDRADKIFYRRHEKYGFFYWRKYSFVDMDQYVQMINQTDKSELTMKDLEAMMATVSNQSLPYINEGLFQILVTKQRLARTKIGKDEYGIIFRIHHSVGDGVALIDFLCKTLADNNEPSTENMFSFPETTNLKLNSPTDLINMIWKLCEIPVCFIDGIIREPDNNALHGPKLVGKKVFKWTESDENIYQKVKEIKHNADGLKFSDVLAAALSAGLYDFFSKKMDNVPEEVAVVLPVRFPKTTFETGLQLKNDFSVTILDLPIKATDNLSLIRSHCDKLRNSADPITNYLFLKLVSSVLPRCILQPLLNSSQATMVFSNMPGPGSVTMCGGNLLTKLVFFVPHKGTTGFGVTSLCYGGVLRFAAMADAELVSTADDLSIILDGMVDEINRLHRHYATTIQ